MSFLRAAVPVAVLLCTCLTVGCTRKADLSLRVPDEARATIERYEFRVYDVEKGCSALNEWARSNCSACASATRPRWENPPTPLLPVQIIDRMPNREFAPLEIDLPGSGDWEVVVIGRTGPDEAGLLFGCDRINPGEAHQISMVYHWCEPAACAELIPLQCNPRVGCTTEDRFVGFVDLVDALPCRYGIGFEDVVVETWTPAGHAPCAPPLGTTWAGTCEPSRFTCNQMVQPSAVCPIGDEEICSTDGSYVATQDTNCDGEVAPCDRQICRPGRPVECGTDGCFATQQCGDDGILGSCVLEPIPESCNGLDDDCDGVIDDEPDAVVDCNAGRDPAFPSATRCIDGDCLCVAGGADSGVAACRAPAICCGGACVNPIDDIEHCGGCGIRCQTVCTRGVCDPGTELVCTIAQCNAGSAPGSPVADGCGSAGQCQCGGMAQCAGGMACCSGTCVDQSRSAVHCGSCGHRCGDAQSCVSGNCVSRIPPMMIPG